MADAVQERQPDCFGGLNMSKETDIEIIGARRAYVQMLRRDLVGPGSEDRSQIPSGCLEANMDGAILDVADESDVADYIYEIITERPGARYKVGLLYPQETKLESNVDGATDPDGEIESEDSTTPIESHVRAETNVNAGTDDVADDVGKGAADNSQKPAAYKAAKHTEEDRKEDSEVDLHDLPGQPSCYAAHNQAHDQCHVFLPLLSTVESQLDSITVFSFPQAPCFRRTARGRYSLLILRPSWKRKTLAFCPDLL